MLKPGVCSGTLLLLSLCVVLLLPACSTYGPSGNYPPPQYSPPPGAGYYQSGHTYYGSYKPGWFIAAPYYPGNYWGYGPMVYWPTYSSSYYYSNHFYDRGVYPGRYYPYSDPWYYPYSGHYRHPYGHYYGPYNGPYYGNGGHYGSGYWQSPGRPYPGNSHTYRPPGGQDEQRPDPVVIPPGQRGGNGPGEGYNDEIDENQRQRELYQSGRRSATVVVEEDGMTRSVGVAPGADGSQGMVTSSRSERKAKPSRLQPVPVDQSVSSGYRGQSPEQIAAPAIDAEPAIDPTPTTGEPQSTKYPTRNRVPRYTVAPVMPSAEVVMPAINRPAGGQSSYEAPAADTSVAMPQRRSYAESPSSYRSQPRGYSAAPGRQASAPAPQPAYQNAPAYQSQPAHQIQPDFDNRSSRGNRGQRRYGESEAEPQLEEQNQ